MVAERLRQKALPIWEKIFNHPFVIELYSGNLPFKKFKYYLLQDYSYLVGISKAFSIIAAKSNPDQMRKILKIAEMEANTEMKNYEALLNEIGIEMEEAIKTKPSPTNYAYVNFIISTSFMEDEYKGMAALLPCFWTYMEIAERNKKLLEGNRSHIYKKWAMEYLSGEYKNLVEMLISIVNEGEYDSETEEIFITASKYEYYFWEMAYKMEEWII